MFEVFKKQWDAYGERPPTARRASRAGYTGCLVVMLAVMLCVVLVVVRVAWAFVPWLTHDVVAPIVRWLTTW
jgi:hypothetical protein